MTQAQASPASSTAARPVRFKSRQVRRNKDRAFVGVCLAAAAASIVALVTLVTSILAQALGFRFDHWFPSVLLGVTALTISGSIITIVITLPAVLRRRATRTQRLSLTGAGALLVLSLAVVAQLWQMREGKLWLTWDLLMNVPSRFPDQAGIWPATVGTIMICLVCAVTAIPIGVATAILLEEFKPRKPWLARPHAFVQLNITNLAGVPSIVYGILGLTVFVQAFNALGTPLNPAFEFGVTRYDRFVTEAGEVLQVPIADRDAPPTDPATVERWRTVDGRPIEIELVQREAFLPRQAAMDEAVEAFQDAVRAAMRADAAMEPAALSAVIEQAWRDAGLTADPAPIQAEMVAGLIASQSMSRRDARRERRHALHLAEDAERQARFPGLLLADAVPGRILDTSPWYIRIPLGRGVLAGGLTLMLVVLPIVIIASQEALRAVPRSMRYASLALGATPWQTVWRVTLPTAIPGIMTGTILAMSRAIGEAAPILVIAGIVFITFTPSHLMDDFTALPLQIFNWAGRPQGDFHAVAAAGIIVLMAILLVFNAVAVLIRQRTQKQY